MLRPHGGSTEREPTRCGSRAAATARPIEQAATIDIPPARLQFYPGGLGKCSRDMRLANLSSLPIVLDATIGHPAQLVEFRF